MARATKTLHEFVELAGIASWHEEGLTDLERLRREPNLVAEVERRMKALFKTRTAQKWEDLAAEAGTECTMCRTSEEWFSHPQALESKMVIELQDLTYGRMLQPGINARMSLTLGEVRGPAPTLDQHREEILSEVASQRPAKASRSSEETMETTKKGAIRSALDGATARLKSPILAVPFSVTSCPASSPGGRCPGCERTPDPGRSPWLFRWPVPGEGDGRQHLQ